MDAKSIKNDLKKDYPFRADKSPKSTKSEPWAQNVPQVSRRASQAPKIYKNPQKKSPRASKITHNHENLVPKIKKILEKRLRESRK